jgi:amidase
MVQDWKAKAEAKRQSILDSIPSKWKLDKVPSPEEQRDVTGKYVQQFLDQKEIEITETDAVGIAKQVASGTWTAVAVTEAFCHRASLAHQLVCSSKANDECFAADNWNR